MKVLVTGGAGYIGSVCVDDLVNRGHEVTVYDNLSTGFSDSVNSDAKLIKACLSDAKTLNDTFNAIRPDAVIHFAGVVRVDESMVQPGKYFDNNVTCGKRLLDVCVKYKIKKFVFSSTAATYGTPNKIPINEEHPQTPINPYGESKLIFEKYLKWYGQIFGLNTVVFRYFNASGATSKRGQKHKIMSHLIPNVLKVALKEKEAIDVFGNDFDTADGTGVRDYIHISDLSSAHINAVENQVCGTFNLGVGRGYSVMEIIQMCEKITGQTISYKVKSRRLGDPASVIADSSLAQKVLNWKPEHSDLQNIIQSAWNWQSSFRQ